MDVKVLDVFPFKDKFNFYSNSTAIIGNKMA